MLFVAFRLFAGIYFPDGQAEIVGAGSAGDHGHSLDIRSAVEGENVLVGGGNSLEGAMLMPYTVAILLKELPFVRLDVGGVYGLEE